jgi:hypothetical protein
MQVRPTGNGLVAKANMDAKQSWERLRSQAESSLDADALLAFAEDLVQAGEPALANYAKAEPKAREQALRRLWAGGLHGVGPLPQFDLCLLAAIGHAAAGRQVFVLSPLPVAPSVVRHATRLLGETLGLNARAAGVVFGQPTSRLKQALKADIVLTDLMQFFDVARENPEFLQRSPAVALICEADLCLYDSRLGIYERGKPQAVAAIYRATLATPPWQENGNVIDTLAVLGQFESVAGVLSYTSGHVAKEIRKVYTPVLGKGCQCRGTGDFRALAFRTLAEKMSALCRDILKADGDCLVFMGDEEFRQNVYRHLRQRDQEPTLLATARDLRTFLGMKSSRKRVGLFRGMPTTFTQPIENRASVHVFLAEHLLMGHQHGKLRAFCDRDLVAASPPTLYFSLEDEMFNIYADRAGVEGFFKLIDFTEKYDKWRQIRRVMAKAVLRRIHRLRRACLNEDHPVFTMIGIPGKPSPQADKASNKGRKKIGKKLEGLCFCGSGKPFRECHGKPKA